MLLLDHGIYYEFLPADQWATPDPRPIPLGEVELHRPYALVISTNAGLWRYVVGDTVRFTSLAPYRVRITGRTKHFLNAFGEELVIENAEAAVAAASQATGAAVRDFTAAPVWVATDSALRAAATNGWWSLRLTPAAPTSPVLERCSMPRCAS